jgi:hypothetical protein
VGIPALSTPMGDLNVAPWLRKMVVSILQESKIAMENGGKIMGKSWKIHGKSWKIMGKSWKIHEVSDSLPIKTY